MVYILISNSRYEDDFSKDTIDNYETAGGATWKIEKGELVSRGAGGDWNVLVVKEKLWKAWTDYTYEVKVTPMKAGSEFIYIVFRYAQPVSTNRQNFFTYLMDGSNVIGLYLDRFINGARTRPVPDTMTFAGAWKNEVNEVYEMKLEITQKTIAGFLNGKEQFKPIKEDNLVEGRIGLGIWGAEANFDDLVVYGPKGFVVDPLGKSATTWGKIKAGF